MGAKRKVTGPGGGGVETYLAALRHPRKDEVLAVRKVILGATRGTTERIKWNAPSFCIDGDDRITFRLQPGNRVQLIFHRGAKVRKGGFTFKDSSGLIEWVTADRGLVDFTDAADVTAKAPALRSLVKAWMEATRVK